MTCVLCHIFPISVLFAGDFSVQNGASALMAQWVKNLPTNVGDARDEGSIPGSGRSPGVGHGNPLQYSCLENSMGRGA